MAGSILARLARTLVRSPDDAAPDLDRVADEVQACRTALVAERLGASRVRTRLAERVDAMSGTVSDCTARGRDDLAQAVLSHRSDLQAHGEALDRLRSRSLEQEARLEESLTSLRLRKRQLDDLREGPQT